MSDIRRDAGVTPEPTEPDVVREGTVVTGENGPQDGFLAPTPNRPSPVNQWSDVDSNYQDLIDSGQEPADVDEEDLDELEAPEGSIFDEGGSQWVSYELWSREVGSGDAWKLLTTVDFEADLETELDGLPTGTAMEFRVRLVDSFGHHSDFSAITSVDMPRDQTPPSRPIGFYVRHEYGLATMGWGGELEDPIPEDFSHVAVVVQQRTTTDGETESIGSPRTVTQFREASTYTGGDLAFGAVHRVWAVAVDTSGNESARSEYYEFTPTPPVDVQAIQEHLEAEIERIEEAQEILSQGMEDREAEIALLEIAKQQLQSNLAAAKAEFESRQSTLETNLGNLDQAQEQLEQNLALGLDHVYDQAEARAQQLANNAAAQVASDAQGWADAAREVAERALAAAGSNLFQDPGFDTNYWIENPPEPDRPARKLLPSEGEGHQGGVGSALVLPFRASSHNDIQRFSPWTSVAEGEVWRWRIRYRVADVSQLGDRATSGVAFRLYFGVNGSNIQHNPGQYPGRVFEGRWNNDTIPSDVWKVAEVNYQVEPDISTIQPQLRVWSPSPTIELAIDTAEFRDITAAYESLIVADAAQAAAEAAHAAAGEARALAVTAQDTASGKADIIRQTSAPTGTAPEGSIWFRYDNMSASRKLIGWWVRESGAWRIQEMDETIVPLINIGGGTYGDLSGDRLTAFSVMAQHIAVGAWDDMIPDPGFATDWWQKTGSFTIVPSYTRNGVTKGPVAVMSTNSSELRTGMYKAIPGARYAVSFDNERGGSQSSDNRYRVFVQGLNSSGNFVQVMGESLENYANTSWNRTTLTFTIPNTLPAGVTQWRVVWRGDSIGGLTVRTANPTMRQRIGGVLIDENGVQSPQIDTQEFFSAEAVIDRLFARTADFFSATIAQAIIGGVNIANDSVDARTVNVNDLFGNTAVINRIYNEIIVTRLLMSEGIITEDMIATGAITTPKLTVTDQMVADFVQVMRLEGNRMDFNEMVGMIIRGGRIEGLLGVYGELQIGDRFTGGSGAGGIALRSGQDSNGTAIGWDQFGANSFRLGGRNNFVSGEFYAKTAENSGVELNSGSVTYRAGVNSGSSWGLDYQNRTSSGPFIKFRRDSMAMNNSPTIVWDESTNELVIVPYQAGSGEDSTIRIPATLDVERLLVEGNTRFQGNLQALGTIGTYNSITLAGTYTHNRPCFYRQLGNQVILGGAVNSHAQNRFGGSIAQLPAPSSVRQLTTARTNSAGGHETMPVQIATNGWMTVPGGAQIESGTPMSLDGLTYLTG